MNDLAWHIEERWLQNLTIIEKTEMGYSAYSPDLLGYVSIEATYPEVEQNMREAIAFHVEGLRLEGYEVPQPSTVSTYIEVSA